MSLHWEGEMSISLKVACISLKANNRGHSEVTAYARLPLNEITIYKSDVGCVFLPVMSSSVISHILGD